MSAISSVPRMAGGEGIIRRYVRILIDVFNWKGYSTLQKWLIVLFVTLVISWLSYLWTITIFFALISAAGVKLTEQILHHDKASIIAEQVFYKLESGYIELRGLFRQLKMIIYGQADLRDATLSSEQILTDLSSVYDADADKCVDGSPVAKISAEIRSELNSIQLLIIRDFIRSWYADFSYDSQFLKESKTFLHCAFNSAVTNISHQNPKVILTKIIQQYHVHFTLYQRAKSSFESHKIHPKTKVPQDIRFKRHSSVDDAFGIVSKFHVAIDSEATELSYLRGVVSIILLSVCETHHIEGPCVRILLVQILTQNVMLQIMKMMSNPDWLMEMIVRITSDEEIIGAKVDKASGESSRNVGDDERNDVKIDEASLSPSTADPEKDSLFEYHECLDKNALNEEIKSKMEDSINVNEHLDSTVCDDTTKHQVSRDQNHLSSQSSSMQDLSTTNLSSQITEFSTSRIGAEQLTTAILVSTVKEANIVDDTEENSSVGQAKCVDDTENDSISKHDTTSKENKNVNSNETQEQKCLTQPDTTLEGDQTLTNFEHDNIESVDKFPTLSNDPQTILSFGKRHSWTSTDSDASSYAGGSVEDTTSFHQPECESSPDSMSKSFPKLFKNFFGGKQQPPQQQQLPDVKKPKTLPLFSGKLPSKFNPLSSKKLTKSDAEGNGDLSKKPPQLQVDGVPLDSQSSVKSQSPTSISAASSIEQLTPSYSDTELTPSPGFFSSTINSIFSMSSSHHNLSDLNDESPAPTPSPTSQSDFSIGGVAVIKDSDSDLSKLRPHVSDDGRIFQDVCIPHTAACTEYRSTNQFSLYIIEYEALYFTEEGKSVIRSGQVKRRYREFTSLQSRLEGHQAYKKYLKKIRGPKRWPSLPFKTMDKDTVETRRLFLEKYLKDLIEIEAICNGPDLREFLAYEGDSHIAFVKKSPDIGVPRIDKMFMRGVSEVVDRIKALPNIPQEVMQGLRGRDTPEEKHGGLRDNLDPDRIDVNITYAVDGVLETGNKLCTECVQVMEHEEDLVHAMLADHKKDEQISEAYRQEVEKVLASLPRIQGDGAESSQEETSAEHKDIELSLAVLDLLVQGLHGRDHWLCRERVVRSMQSVLGKALNRYLESAISSLTTEEELARYLRLLRETIWPQGQLWSESSSPKTDDQRAATREQAKRCLINFFPETVKLVVGRKEFEDMISGFLNSLESEQLNRHLLYQILDLLVEQLFPKITDHDLLHNLLFSKPRNGHSEGRIS